MNDQLHVVNLEQIGQRNKFLKVMIAAKLSSLNGRL